MPDIGKYEGFDHITFWVGNAKQAASWYVTRFGFEVAGYRGLETNDRDYVSWAVKQNRIVFVFTSPLNPGEQLINEHIAKHGDGVRDVAFTVDDAKGIFKVNHLCTCKH